MKFPASWKPFLLPVGITIGIRLLWMVVVWLTNPETGHFMFDSELYWHFASTMVEHGEMSYTNGIDFVPVHTHTPLYPFIIYGFIVTGLSTKGLIIFQILCTGATAVFLIKTARLLFENDRVGVIAAILVAVDVPSIIFSNMVMSETIYTTLFAMALFWFVRYLKEKVSVKMMFIAGFLLGLAILCRAVGLFVPLLFLLWIAMRWKSTARPLLAAGLLSLGVSIPVSAWMIRNYVVFDEVFVTTLSSTNIYFYRAAGVIADQEGRALYQVHRDLQAQHPTVVHVDHPREYIQQSRFYRDEGIRILSENVGTYAKIHAIAIVKLLAQPMRQPIEIQLGFRKEEEAVTGWTNIREGNVVQRVWSTTSGFTMGLLVLQFLHLGLIWIFFLKAGIRLIKERHWLPLIISIGIVLYYCAIAAGPETDARFRVPLIPFIALMAAYGMVKNNSNNRIIRMDE